MPRKSYCVKDITNQIEEKNILDLVGLKVFDMSTKTVVHLEYADYTLGDGERL